jgi:hypothetical protein
MSNGGYYASSFDGKYNFYYFSFISYPYLEINMIYTLHVIALFCDLHDIGYRLVDVLHNKINRHNY